MRNLFLRFFALAIVVAMGLLAIAHAQRATSDPFAGQGTAGTGPSNPLRSDAPVDNTAAPQASELPLANENPLRPQQATPGQSLDTQPRSDQGIPPRSMHDAPLRPAQAFQISPIQDNPLRPSQNDPMRSAQTGPLHSAPTNPFRPNSVDPFASRPDVTNDRAVRTVADNEPANGPALTEPPYSGPNLRDPVQSNAGLANAVQANAAQTTPISISMGEASTPTAEPRLLPPSQVSPETAVYPGPSSRSPGKTSRLENGPDNGPDIATVSSIPDMPATPPFGQNRPLSATPIAVGAAASTNAPSSSMPSAFAPTDPATSRPLAATSYRNDSPLGRELPAINGPTNEDNTIAAASPQTSGVDGMGRPGERSLEGPQSPQLTVQKVVPPEIQVNRPAVLRTIVRNSGAAIAKDVEIHDMVPKGTRLLGTAPRAQQGPHGELTWSIGSIKPGEESAVEMQVMPVEEGDVGSVATVQFQAAATARSRCTRPRLVVETVGTPQVLMGDEAALTFTVSNPGTGMATGVVLQERIPAGAQHPSGKELEYTVGDLRPGESRKLELRLKAVQAGVIANLIVAKGDAGLKAEHRFAVQVVSPQLDVVMNGPKRRYLEREATYQLSVTNPGTAPAQQVQLVAYLPPGLKFVNANNAGHYDEVNRAVSWRLDELPVNAQGSVQLVTMPIEAGEQSIKLRGTAQRGLTVEKEHPVVVEGLAAVSFQMGHTRDLIEIGGETSYEVSVVNQGSKASTNLRLVLNLPPQLKAISADGPARYSVSNDQVVFESLPQLPPKSVVTYHVKVKGLQAGDLRVRCQLMSDEMQAPVSKEDSTRVYGDE